MNDAVVDRVVQHVLDGMGLVALHSSHYSKPFLRLMGTRCSLRWRNDGEREVVWTVAPAHDIAEGVPPVFVIPEHEMYGEYFDIPPPDELVFISSFGRRRGVPQRLLLDPGARQDLLLCPGHETFPVYRQPRSRASSRTPSGGRAGERLRSSRRRRRSRPLGWYEALDEEA